MPSDEVMTRLVPVSATATNPTPGAQVIERHVAVASGLVRAVQVTPSGLVITKLLVVVDRQTLPVMSPHVTAAYIFKLDDQATDMSNGRVPGALLSVQVLASALVMVRATFANGNVEELATATNFACSGDQTIDCQAPDPAESCVVHLSAVLLSVAALTCLGVMKDVRLITNAHNEIRATLVILFDLNRLSPISIYVLFSPQVMLSAIILLVPSTNK
jgi:hypothetical protein